MKNNNDGLKRIKSKIFPVSLGLLWGISFGIALHSCILGLSIGFLWAFALGASDDKENTGHDT